MNFDELHTKRRNYVQAARENNFEKGLRDLLSHLYPDNAHFIYELLQNAEDAQASEVHFQLESSRLVTEHDGRRVFSIEDIDAITGIGGSTKVDDETAIGKFGVGFKAIFDYTSRPEIQSGEYSFAIDDLFVPVRIDGKTSPGWTRFTFPFNRDEKPSARAVEEITRALRDLEHSSLLFLSSISLISYTLPNGQGGSLERSSHATDQNQISITLNVDGDESQRHWMRFTDQFQVDDDGKSKKVTVGAAFALEDITKPSKTVEADGADPPAAPTESRRQIAELEQGDVCIFFPAVKEVSGLRFHIHAPFASTVARDSVRDTPGNASMVAAIGQLLVDALPGLRDAGYLTDGLLSALPHDEDSIPSPYSVIQSKIVEAFNSTALTPVLGRDGFAPAKELVDGPRYFRGALDNSDVDVLYRLYEGQGQYRWIASASGNGGKFLKSLHSLEFSELELSEVVESIADGFEDPSWSDDWPKIRSEWEEWLTSKPNRQLKKLYALLGEAQLEAPRTFSADSLSRIPLVRVGKANEWIHVLGSEVYLPQSPQDSAAGRVPIDLAFFEEDEHNKEMNSLRAFYKSAGVKRWNKVSDVEEHLKRYRRKGPKPSVESKEYLRDLRKFLTAHRDKNLGQIFDFRHAKFLAGESMSGEIAWCAPWELFVDEPFAETGLISLHQRLDETKPWDAKNRLWPGYVEILTEKDTEVLVDLAVHYGAQKDIKVQSTLASDLTNELILSTWFRRRESKNTESVDWIIPYLQEIVSTQDPALLRNLWRTVAHTKARVGIAIYQANAQSPRHEVLSRAAQELRKLAWVLDRDGNLRTPAGSTEKDLAPLLEMPSASSLLDHLEFGREADKESERAIQQRKVLEEAGFDSEMQELLQQAQTSMTRDEFKVFLREAVNRPKTSELKFDPTLNLDERQSRVAEDAAETPHREFQMREQRVEIGKAEVQEEARAYLRPHYLDGEGRVICQVCLRPMPFMVRGKDFFEAVQCVRKRAKAHKQNRLALCPTCAAKFKHARDTPIEVIKEAICDRQIKGDEESVQVSVRLAGEDTSISFTVKHFADIQAVLKESGAELQKD